MMEGTQSMLELEKVSKAFKGVAVLQEVNLSVPTGHTHALIGTSGSGKTTLLRILLGLTPLDTGWVKINNRPLSEFSPKNWADQIGYVPQDGGLFPHLTIYENVTLMGQSRGLSKTKISERVEQMLPTVDLVPELLEKYPWQLSGGQKQRASIMRAIFLNPSILLLDEPMGALDPIIRQSLQIELKKVFEALKKTVLIVTHDLSEAVYLSNEMTLLHEGRVIQTGTYPEFDRAPKDPFVTQFVNAHRGLPKS
jgi:osmoprotectant transport system ATP-binding protein